jgi:hypothetical protein
MDRVKKWVHPDRWPNNQMDSFQGPSDVLHVLLEASELSNENNKLFKTC